MDYWVIDLNIFTQGSSIVKTKSALGGVFTCLEACDHRGFLNSSNCLATALAYRSSRIYYV